MVNLVKMDLRRLFLSKVFYASVAVVAVFNILFQLVPPLFLRLFAPGQVIPPMQLSDFLAKPFSVSLLIVAMVISIVSFSFADIANGYIKNIAGQIPNKSHLIYSKYIVIGIHNCVFMLVSMLTNLLGAVIVSMMGLLKLETDSLLGSAALTFLIKWMLTMAISAILLFFAMAVKSKTVATVIGVVLGTGALGMVYFGLNRVVESIFNVQNVSVESYVPDQLINSVNVGTSVAVLNAVIVALVCSALFIVLTVKVFNSRDVK